MIPRFGNILLICVLALVSSLLVQSIINQGDGFNADGLQYMAVYRDFFQYHYPLSGWPFLKTPHFFPAFGLYSVLYYLTGDFGAVYLMFELLDLLCLTLLFILVCKQIFPRTYQHAVVPIVLFVTYALLVEYHSRWLLVNLTVPWVHLLTTLITLLFLYLLFRYWYNSHWRVLMFLGVLSFLVTISDELFLPSLSIPCLLAGFLCYCRRQAYPLKLISVIGLASILGLLVNHALPGHDQHVHSLTDIPLFLQALPLFFKDYYAWFMSAWLLSFAALIYLGLRFFFGNPQAMQRSWPAATDINLLRFFTYYLLAMPACVIGAMLFLNLFKDIFSSRYLTTPLLFPIYAMVCFVSIYLGHKIKSLYLLLITLILSGILLLNLIFAKDHAGLTFQAQWRNWYPDVTSCVDHFSAEYPSRYGLANYWDAHLITLYSKQNLWANQTTPTGEVKWWVNNKYWYFSDKDNRNQLPQYSFVVINRLIDPVAFIQNLGKPDKIINCQAVGFATKDKIFIYKQPNAIAKFNQNFLQLNQKFFQAMIRRA